MKNIAILTGGDSGEYDISLLSANAVLNNLNPKLFNGYIVHFKAGIFNAVIDGQSIPIKKSDFSFIHNKKTIILNQVFMALHGPPAENGKIQPYFDKLKIPYTSCNNTTSSLTFNKYQCNEKLIELGFKCALSLLYKKEDIINIELITKQLGLPCFIKPNKSGSSLGISKVKKKTELKESINNALLYDEEVIIEQFIEGTEVSCGVYFDGNNVIPLPITEIISKNEFFDYEAKYHGKSEEITPARIQQEIYINIQNISTNIYRKMQLRGICRIDYIIMKKEPYIIEINTIPGLSEKSIIPQQIKSAKLKLSEVLDACLLNSK